jgi:hypothetical protein
VTDFPSHLKIPTIVGSATTLLVLAAALAHDAGVPPVVPLLLLAGLAIVAEHQRVGLRSGIDISPGLVVLAASLVVFRTSDALAGPIIVGACSGLHLASFETRRRGWLVFHASSSALAAAVATGAYWLVPQRAITHLPVGVLALVPAAALAVGVEALIVSLSYRGSGVDRPPVWLPEAPIVVVALAVFAASGAVIALLAGSLGAAMLLFLFVPVLLAPQALGAAGDFEAGHEETIRTLMRALEVKDPYTAKHAERVADLATYIGIELDVRGARLERLRLAALLHDIGKLVVPNALLNKPGRLTVEEFAVVRRHEAVSIAMLSRIDALVPVAQTVADARHDSPFELRTLDAHIIAVADAYDAMASTRSYRRALPQDVVFAELRDKSGTQFLGPCVEALIRALGRRDLLGVVDDQAHDHNWPVAPPVAGVGSAGLGDLVRPDIALEDLELADVGLGEVGLGDDELLPFGRHAGVARRGRHHGVLDLFDRLEELVRR